MSTSVRQAMVGAGSNLGDRCATLREAVRGLQAFPGITALEPSPVYETDPVGNTDQPLFLNLVLGIETTLDPETLLSRLLECEMQFGRVRTTRWGPRTLDLDLLAFENETRATPFLQLPHPRMLERAFVAVPLRDVLSLPLFNRPCWDDLREKLRYSPSSGTQPFPDCKVR